MTTLPINEIVCGSNGAVMATFPDECIDLTVTSPPYDNLRAYKGYTWSFKYTSEQLWRVTKQGGVVVWVVADATVDGSESGTSFRQALAFMALGFRLHDTMIYEKNNYIPLTHNRYEQAFEFMFVLSKGTPKTFNALTRLTSQPGATKNRNSRHENHAMRGRDHVAITPETKRLANVWAYECGYNLTTKDGYAFEHPALLPEKLAEDHILSWSNPGDVVLDPFVGSGTTAKMAIKHHRQFIGIDISPEYCDLARRRIGAVQPTMFDIGAY